MYLDIFDIEMITLLNALVFVVQSVVFLTRIPLPDAEEFKFPVATLTTCRFEP
nr:MAG: hypothetical protein CM15mV30_1250 [uncultured marine virus]